MNTDRKCRNICFHRRSSAVPFWSLSRFRVLKQSVSPSNAALVRQIAQPDAVGELDLLRLAGAGLELEQADVDGEQLACRVADADHVGRLVRVDLIPDVDRQA